MRRRRRRLPEVELNLAAMLDMAFQLLTFFILTFKPAPIEGELALNLPPPIPVTAPQQDPQITADEGDAVLASTNSLIITVHSNGNGVVKSVGLGPGKAFVGEATEANMHELERQLRGLFKIAHTPYDQVLIRVAPDLHYEELMKIIDVCTKQQLPDGTRLQKISFAELQDGAA